MIIPCHLNTVYYEEQFRVPQHDFLRQLAHIGILFEILQETKI